MLDVLGLLLYNTSSLQQAEGDLEPWRPLTWEDLETSLATLGRRHPATLASTNQMASQLQAQGDLAAAATLFWETLVARRATLGDRHPDTLVSINNTARLLYEQGKLEAAERLLHESTEACRATLAPGHRTRLRAHGWLADVCRAQGRHAIAREVLDAVFDAVLTAPCASRRAVLIAARAALGPTVDTTLMLEALDARLRIHEGEGLEPLREVLRRMSTVLGPCCPETQRCQRALAEEEEVALCPTAHAR